MKKTRVKIMVRGVVDIMVWISRCFFSINLIHGLHRSPAVLVLFAAFGLRFNSASSATSAAWHWILQRCHAFLLKAVM